MLDVESSMLITAIASSAAENLDLYEKVLGLRLVKKPSTLMIHTRITCITEMRQALRAPFRLKT